MTDLPTLKPIPNAAERIRAAKNFDELMELTDARIDASEPILAELRAVLAPVLERHKQEVLELSKPFKERMEQAEAEFQKQAEALDVEAEKLEEVIGKGGIRLTECHEAVITCALTGCAIFEDDDVVVGESSGEFILAAALPWPESEAAE